MSDLSKVDLSRFGEAALFLPNAAECVAKAESTIGVMLWECGQALHYVKANCPPSELEAAWETLGLKPTRARQYIDVYERWPKIEDVPAVGKSLLFVLAGPEAPAEAVEAIVERVESGEAVTVREATAELQGAKAQTSARDHDVDRTHQAPEQSGDVKAGCKAVRKIATQVRSILKGWPELNYAIADQLVAISDQIRDDSEVEGLDVNTVRACVEQAYQGQ